jgi:hypothetical protein
MNVRHRTEFARPSLWLQSKNRTHVHLDEPHRIAVHPDERRRVIGRVRSASFINVKARSRQPDIAATTLDTHRDAFHHVR